MNAAITLGVGVVVERGGAVLLIRRGKPPFMGLWSIPGGRLEPGERLADAALRELLEETGTQAEIVGLIDVYESVNEHGHYVMIDYAARWTSGEPSAGDDALEAAFVPAEEALARVGWDQTRLAVRAGLDLLARQNFAPKSR